VLRGGDAPLLALLPRTRVECLIIRLHRSWLTAATLQQALRRNLSSVYGLYNCVLDFSYRKVHTPR
jgi:hypothetical protein